MVTRAFPKFVFLSSIVKWSWLIFDMFLCSIVNKIHVYEIWKSLHLHFTQHPTSVGLGLHGSSYLHQIFGVRTPDIFWKANWWNNPLPLHPFQAARHKWKLHNGKLQGEGVRPFESGHHVTPDIVFNQWNVTMQIILKLPQDLRSWRLYLGSFFCFSGTVVGSLQEQLEMPSTEEATIDIILVMLSLQYTCKCVIVKC